jgi:hypothetical protein
VVAHYSSWGQGLAAVRSTCWRVTQALDLSLQAPQHHGRLTPNYFSEGLLTDLHKLQTEFSNQESSAREHAKELGNGVLEDQATEALVAHLAALYAVIPAEVYFDEIALGRRVFSDSYAEIPSPGSQFVEISFSARCNSSARLLGDLDKNLVTGNDSDGWQIQRRYVCKVEDMSDATVGGYKAEWQADLRSKLAAANTAIQEHKEKLMDQVRALVTMRKAPLAILSNSARIENLRLAPLGKSVVIPVTATSLNLPKLDARAMAGEPESVLADYIADELVKTMRSFALALERQHKVSARMLIEDEESLRDMLLFILNAQWEGLATGETFVGGGKTDILLRWRNRNAFIGECKIWTGEAAFGKAINQLLNYVVWRDTRAGLILFIRNKNDVEGMINKARNRLKNHPNFNGLGSSPDEFLLHAKDDEDRVIRVSLIPVHIPKAEQSAPLKGPVSRWKPYLRWSSQRPVQVLEPRLD